MPLVEDETLQLREAGDAVVGQGHHERTCSPSSTSSQYVRPLHHVVVIALFLGVECVPAGAFALSANGEHHHLNGCRQHFFATEDEQRCVTIHVSRAHQEDAQLETQAIAKLH